jgi:urease accessory protein
LLQLASASLPVGAYSYSQGLESAIAGGAVRNERDLLDWLATVLEHGVASWDATWVTALLHAHRQRARREVVELNDSFLASRETSELRAETVQTGRSLLALVRETDRAAIALLDVLTKLDAGDGLAYPTVWCAVAVARGLEDGPAAVAYLWSWLENAVLAAMKTLPLGQRAGQRLLMELGGRLPALSAAAAVRPIEQCCNFLPGLALASMAHETQYTRLFRS